MDDYRSKSCRDGRNMQMERYHNGEDRPNGVHKFRSYSTNHAPAYVMSSVNEVEIKKVKKTGSFGSTGKSWSFNDAELKRKKRVVGYRVYSVEGRVKDSLRKSFSWIKDLVHGWR